MENSKDTYDVEQALDEADLLAEIFDAPCCNLAGCKHLKWTAYTYLVDLPSRMNGNKLEFLAGYSWGYEEDENGPQRLLPLEVLTEKDWEKHVKSVFR